MGEQTLYILDQSLIYALWAFMVVFLISLFFIRRQLKARKQGLADYFQEEFEQRLEDNLKGKSLSSETASFVFLSDRIRMATRALVLSALLAIACFVVVGFTPLSLFDNFTNRQVWTTAPLRLTLLNYERFYEGFSVDGEVWNQGEEPLTGIRASIQIWGSERDLLEEVSVPVQPDPFLPRSSGTFSLRYTTNSPFLYGYRVLFVNEEGQHMSHVKGFDVY